MSVATIRRARRVARQSLRVVELHNDEALRPYHEHKQNMLMLNLNQFVGVQTYEQAIDIKIEYDHAASFVNHTRVFIQPVSDGYVCQIKCDAPENNPSRASEVERVNWLAEEWGCSVETLLNNRPHLIERSSGGNHNRL